MSARNLAARRRSLTATAREDQSLRTYAGWRVGITLVVPMSESEYNIDPRHFVIGRPGPVRAHRGVAPSATIILGLTSEISLRSRSTPWATGGSTIRPLSETCL